VIDIVAGVLLVSGSLLALLAAVGLHRFPDVFARMHAATKPATLGLLLVVIGAALRVDEGRAVTKLLLVAAFQFLTAPVAAHMIGRAAYRAGTELSPETSIDELAEADRSNG
jgi:multicomponent Na+:H+ antiporter subunit G